MHALPIEIWSTLKVQRAFNWSRKTIALLLKFYTRAGQIRGFSREFVTLRVAQFVLKIAHLFPELLRMVGWTKEYSKGVVWRRETIKYIQYFQVILRFFYSAFTIIKYTKGKINLTPETESQYLIYVILIAIRKEKLIGLQGDKATLVALILLHTWFRINYYQSSTGFAILSFRTFKEVLFRASFLRTLT